MKKYAKYAVAAALVAMGAYQANAMTVNWGDLGVPITYSNGYNVLPTGSADVYVGSDTLNTVGGFTLWAAGADVNDVNPNGTGVIGDGVADGLFAESDGGAGAGFFNAQIYIEVGNGNALVTNPSWKFGASDSSTSTIDIGDPGLVIVVGSLGTTTDEYPGTPGLISSIPLVPEPSSIALVVMGLLGGLTLIRLRS